MLKKITFSNEKSNYRSRMQRKDSKIYIKEMIKTNLWCQLQIKEPKGEIGKYENKFITNILN